MNALEKLVVAKGYRRFITEDHIADELFAASSGTIGLDHHVPEMMHTFCRTMGELARSTVRRRIDLSRVLVSGCTCVAEPPGSVTT